MRTFVSASIAAALILVASPATAAGSSPDGKAEAGARKICRLIERSGSRLQDRVCLTAEQWKKVDQLVAE
jgi:hypothetical protein